MCDRKMFIHIVSYNSRSQREKEREEERVVSAHTRCCSVTETIYYLNVAFLRSKFINETIIETVKIVHFVVAFDQNDGFSTEENIRF